MNNGSPWVIVTTYGRYHSSTRSDYRIELDDFESRADFLSYCADLYSDEDDPGIMFLDWSPCLKPFIAEHGIDPAAFQLAELDQHDRQVIAAWCLHWGKDDHELPRNQDQFERVLMEFKGIYSTGQDFMKHQWFEDADSQGIKLEGLLFDLAIDWQATWETDLKYVQVEFMGEQYFFTNLEQSIF